LIADVSRFSGTAHPEDMTTNRIWLGLIAALSIAACSSKDPLLNGHGGGGAGGGAGTTGGAGTGGDRACVNVQCLRPYECIRTCGGPIVSSGCCPCEAPLFDNFQNLACGGSSGTGGTTGIGGQGGSAVSCDGGAVFICTDGTRACSLTACPSGTAGTGGGAGRGGTGGTAGASGRGGTGGAAGGGGTGGAAGRGGTGGVAGTVGGAPGGRGGAGGTTGAAGSAGGTGGRVDGGADARACETAQCIRPYICIRACGGPIVTNNCCPCEAPLFDDFMGMACGDGGTGATSYVGCRFIGGSDRIVVAKRDTSRNQCVNVVFSNGTAPAGLTLPTGYGLESVSVVLPSECPTRRLPSAGAGPVTGTATWAPLGNPSTADVDVVVTLPGNDEALIASGVDVNGGCL
jgi:hypothetical protein